MQPNGLDARPLRLCNRERNFVMVESITSRKEKIEKSRLSVAIKALEVTDNKNGTFFIILEGQAMSSEEKKIFERLFPNLSEQAYELLNKEALFASLAKESDLTAPETKTNNY
jgi:LytS/YehU family sensor histidine kinase